jgi:uncharacterized Rmd1/YagE family protein
VPNVPFAGVTTLKARALYLGERLDIRVFESTSRLSPQAPLTIAAGERGVAVLFRYGVVALFHLTPLEEVAFVDNLKRLLGEPFAKPEVEELEIRVVPVVPVLPAGSERPDGRADVVENNVISVAELNIDRVQLIAEILARTVALARYEATMKESVAAVETWALALQQGKSGRALERNLLKNLGATIVVQSSMSGRIEIDDKPELLWERPDLERIYARLEDEFELKERDKALERKLALISTTAETLLNLVDNRHAHRLEWYIIGLIVVEMIISLVSLGLGLSH